MNIDSGVTQDLDAVSWNNYWNSDRDSSKKLGFASVAQFDSYATDSDKVLTTEADLRLGQGIVEGGEAIFYNHKTLDIEIDYNRG
ncbi:hypothetical protein ELS19_19390 [Halogeometricum borinquense]|uniref:Uncharacterized protein n=1 Tax=Halogeometricum borinquense TaxID=60847 RepID=A0A482SYB8_9EURY|nr:hypothetical protein [Halogeometricum borinquense]RYJ08648.1 hypothetical protein ELS19_19390 [Halogeometricum borinquense]